jgi:hypothetical protein
MEDKNFLSILKVFGDKVKMKEAPAVLRNSEHNKKATKTK